MLRKNKIWRNTLAGLVGGIVASFVMAQLSVWMKKSVPSLADASGDTHEDEPHDPKVKLAEKIAGHEPSPAVSTAAKPLVHYGFGGGMGAVYGALAALRPEVAAGWGLPFGAAVWLAADEVGLKIFRLARPSGQSTSAHVLSLGTHLAFGVVTDLVRRELIMR